MVTVRTTEYLELMQIGFPSHDARMIVAQMKD